MSSSQVEHDTVHVGMPRVAAHKAVLSWTRLSEGRVRQRAVVPALTNDVLDVILVLKLGLCRRIPGRCGVMRGLAQVVVEVGSATVAQTIGVVGWSAVRHTSCCFGVGVTEVVSLRRVVSGRLQTKAREELTVSCS